MKLGIIGSGSIGKSIGCWAAKLGYEVTFSSRNEENAKKAVKEAGSNAKFGSFEDAIKGQDMVLLAIPYSAVLQFVTERREILKGKLVIDPTNPITTDYRSLAIGLQTSAAEEIAKLIPEAEVVKGFNTILSQIFASQNSRINGQALSIFLAGDDKFSKKRVSELAQKMGFDVVDCGPIANARNLEPLALLNIYLGYVQGYGNSVGFSFLR